MPLLLIAALVASPSHQHQQPSLLLDAPTGFKDEMRSLVPWYVYNPARTPAMTTSRHGLKMTLSHVPGGWPYEYQWSGARRKIHLDVARYGRLIAELPEVTKGSYAHFEVGILDASDHEVKSLRSASLTEPGQLEFDLAAELLPAVYTIDLRLIVGGSNEGASVTYRWVRAISQDYQKTRPIPNALSNRRSP